MTNPRTIDNLGVDVSTRYAEDKEILDETLIKEARAIPAQTEIAVTTPSFPSELESLLPTRATNIAWALFIAPEQYYEQRKRLFTIQLIPSLGSDDKKESQAQKILNKLKSMAEEKEKEEEQKQDKRKRYEQERILEEKEREKKILTSLLDTISLFDKLIIDINSRRSQYQKG